MTRNIGILLRKHTKNIRTIYFLDKERGKLCASSNRSDLVHGALVIYNLNLCNSNLHLSNIDVLDTPKITTIEDLIFFHQVLELTYFFIPIGEKNVDIFNLILFLYTSITTLNSTVLRKLFLCKLFSHLGFYPEKMMSAQNFLHKIRIQHIDNLLYEPLDFFLERKLDQWLDYCISLHPYAKDFKTISLYMNRKS